MEFSEGSAQIFTTFAEDPSNPRSVYALGSLFWSTLTSKISSLLRDKQDVGAFIEQERDFINFGLLKQVREDYEAVKLTLQGNFAGYRHLKISLLSDWLIETIQEIVAGNQKELLGKDIKRAQIQIERIKREIASVQEDRKEQILGLLSAQSVGVLPSGSTLVQVQKLAEIDAQLFESLRIKKAISKGAFFSVDERRAFVAKESQLQKELAMSEALMSQVKSTRERANLNNLNTKITELYSKIVTQEDSVGKMETRIEEIDLKQQTLSPAEIENRTQRAITYIRDLVKLCARRLRIESCSILRPKDSFFTPRELCSCFDRVYEFDPRVFCNDRASFLGKPSVLLIPGNGNALYDWKNNQFLVPLIAPGGDFMGSIAAAIIEYRLDVDDEKRMLTSYLKLPEYRGVRSTYQLKTRLTKDYISWMTSEYKGFRVLSKDVKKWFEHEIAPSRKEIFCPPELQQFNMSAKDFHTMLDDIEARTGKELVGCDEHDLWVASILNCQQGNFERAFELVRTLVDKNQQHVFGYYNLGHIGMRISRKQDALHGFSEFSKRNPQSWWAAVARDHMRRLQAN